MRLWRVSLPALALAGLLLLLGHDAIMAANPHAQSSSVEDAVSHTPVETVCHLPEGDRNTPSGLPDPWATSPAIHVLPEVRVPKLKCVSWYAAPGHPPDVLRAFLQVFLN